jgi:hypothetical protein
MNLVFDFSKRTHVLILKMNKKKEKTLNNFLLYIDNCIKIDFIIDFP